MSVSNLFSTFPKPLLLGHRGAKAYAPENTMQAFELALAHGCDGFEFDVRLSGDGQAVVCHDPKFRRLTIAKTPAAVLVSRGVPRLAHVLHEFAPRAFLDIELKVPGLEKITLDLLSALPSTRGCIITSFLPEVLHELRKMSCPAPLGLICRNRKQLNAARNLSIEVIVLHASLVSSGVAQGFADRNIVVLTWGATRERHMRSHHDAGVHSLIIDDTALAVEVFRKSALAAGNP